MEARLSKRGKLFCKLAEKIGFSVLAGAVALISGFTGHPIIAFAMTVWCVIEVKGALKAFWRYNEEPTICIEMKEVNRPLEDLDEKESEEPKMV